MGVCEGVDDDEDEAQGGAEGGHVHGHAHPPSSPDITWLRMHTWKLVGRPLAEAVPGGVGVLVCRDAVLVISEDRRTSGTDAGSRAQSHAKSKIVSGN